MREFLQLDDDLFVIPHCVAAVKRSGLEDDACTIFIKGQSALDGFLVKMSAEDVVDELEDAMKGE
jgi:hypothetical protein